MNARIVGLGVLVLGLGLLVAPAGAADDPAAPFLGEWGITIQNVDGFPACWLKVFRKDDGGLDARLLWRWGSVTAVKSVKVEGKELVWVRPEYWEEKEKSVDTTYRARVQATDPDSDRLTFAWDIRPEVEIPPGSYAGSLEKPAKPIDGLIRDPTRRQIEFTTPQAAGPYRIFVTIFDGAGHAAYGNVPFFVKGN